MCGPEYAYTHTHTRARMHPRTHWEECIICCSQEDSYVNVYSINDWLCPLLIFCLLVPSMIERRGLAFPIIIMYFSISLFSFISFCLKYFESFFKDAYTCRLVITSWRIDFYHYIISLLLLENIPCPEAYFVILI